MKANQLAGILTLTAGLATQVSFPSVALAQSTQLSEPSFAKEISLISDLVRMKQKDGTITLGHIRISAYQEQFTPEDANELKAEMSGDVYFVSEDEKSYVDLAGGEGEVLFDLINKGTVTNTYQIYGCSSTVTGCTGSPMHINFTGSEVTLFNNWNSEFQFEIWNETRQAWDQTYYINLKK